MKCVVTGVDRKETPEERVRQAIALELMRRYGYRREDLRLELPVQMGSSADKRADIAIFRPETGPAQRTQENAYVLVECKRADVSSAGFDAAKAQLKSYMAACNNCHFGIVVAGSRRVAYHEVKLPDGHYKIVEIPDIPHAMAPRAQFTVVGEVVPLPSRGESSSRPSPPLRPRARSAGRPPARSARSGALALLLVAGAAATLIAWKSRAGTAALGHGSFAPAAATGAPDPGGLSRPVPRARTAPPRRDEWSAASEVRLAPAGCYRKVVREWLKFNCSSQTSPRAIRGARDLGAVGADYFVWETAGSVIELVARMVPGRRGEAVFEIAGGAVVAGYDWTQEAPSPVVLWSAR